MNHLRLLVLFVLAAAACTDKRPDATRDIQPAPADAPPALGAAHDAYLAGDWAEMNDRLRDVIVDPRAGELAKDNAFALLESAYDATKGKLPARNAVASDVSLVSFGVLNGMTAFGPHRLIFLDLHVAPGRGAHVTNARVTRLPGDVMLDASAGLGTLRAVHDSKEYDEVKLERRQLDVLPDRGAFAIEIAFDDAKTVETFVLASKLVASAQPEVTSPLANAVLDDPRPEITWQPFRSPEIAPWETRGTWIGISHGPKDELAWSFYEWDAGERARVRVGEPGTTPASLAPDSYWIDFMAGEERRFGGVRISRLSSTARPFRVVR
jgi:hypothetical protein